jgi:molybdate transport system substrate-binding protein
MTMVRGLLIAGLLLLASCNSRAPSAATSAVRLVAFVAASTNEPMAEIARAFEAKTGIPVLVSPGPSSGLAKQIEQGADADLLLSADQPTADFLADKGLVAERRNLLRNKLVVITPHDRPLAIRTLEDLTDQSVTRLAIANPSVPAGEYARDALKKAGVWDRVESKIVGGVDVRATLQYVALGEVEAGIVYYTDAAASSKVVIALQIPPELHRPIEYPIILIRRASSHAAARQFFDFLQSELAAEVFHRFRFETVR